MYKMQLFSIFPTLAFLLPTIIFLFGVTSLTANALVETREKSLNDHLLPLNDPVREKRESAKIVRIPNREEINIPNKRRKRAAWIRPTYRWPHRIPYAFAPSYPQDLRLKFKHIINEIMDNVCVTFVETPNFDPQNNTFGIKAFLYVNLTLGVRSDGSLTCSSVYGHGNATGPRYLNTCRQYSSMIHETLHALGVIHEQSSYLRGNRLTIFSKNLEPGVESANYKVIPSNEVTTSEFDASGIMTYSRRSFSINGMDVLLPIDDEEFDLNDGRHSNLMNIYRDLSDSYKCKETLCSHVNIDCGHGYLTKLKGKCQCRCPEGFDPKTNCKNLTSGDNEETSWPDVPFSMYAGIGQECPEGFTKSRVDVTGRWTPRHYVESFFSEGYVTNFYVCKRNVSPHPKDMDNLPMGTYCIIKPQDQECGENLIEGGFILTSMANITQEGEDFGWEIQPDKTKIKMRFCCRNDKDFTHPIELPNQTPFRLIQQGTTCPKVKDMRVSIGYHLMFLNEVEKYGLVPRHVFKPNNYFVFYFCSYIPGIYGCNRQVRLDANHRKETLLTPGFETGQRESQRRCLYHFEVPKGSRIKITFNEFDVDHQDMINVRRFHKWALPFRNYRVHYRKQLISDKDFLFLEYWAGINPTSGKKGINFTAEVVLAEDLCYNKEDRGESYTGKKWVAEHFEECVPWKDAVGCFDFPFNGTGSLDLLDHNYCRNVGGSMERPWCYVSVDRGMCRRHFCDVCNNLDPVDQVLDCSSMSNPEMCSAAMQRSRCAHTCGLSLNGPQSAEQNTCGVPPTPNEAIPSQDLKTEYTFGETAAFRCAETREGEEVEVRIQCSKKGWPSVDTACSHGCYDKTAMCAHAIITDPAFCSRPRSLSLATSVCQKSCGICGQDGSVTCKAPEVDESYRMTSSAGEILPGQFMEFACNHGFFLKDGHLKRACGVDGQLSGNAPNCIATLEATDVGKSAIMFRLDRQPIYFAYLIDVDNFRIPFDGRITHWHYFGLVAGPINFIVYRQANDSANMQLVGYNTVQINVINEKWTTYIPPDQQISVKKGDSFGMHTTSGKIAVTFCGQNVMNVRQERNSFTNLIKADRAFASVRCLVPSLGVRVSPGTV